MHGKPTFISYLLRNVGFFIYINKKGGIKITKGQIEAKISEAVTKFELEIMGRGPKEIKTSIIKDLIIIRQKGFFSLAEKKLAKNKQGIELLKNLRTMLFENEEEEFKKIIKDIIELNILSIHSDVSTKSGEKIIVVTVDKNLEIFFNL